MSAVAVKGFGWSSRDELIAAIDHDLLAWNLKSNPPSLVGRQGNTDLISNPQRYVSVAMHGTDIGWAVTIPSELRTFRVANGRVEVMESVKVPGEGNSRICRIDPGNRRLAIGKADGSVVLFDTTTKTFGSLLTEVHADSVQAMVWLSERRLVTGSRDGGFAVWDVSDEGEASLWYRLQLDAPVSDIAPTADKRGVYVACSDETSLRVLDLSFIDSELTTLFSKTSSESISEPVPPFEPIPDNSRKPPVKQTNIAGTLTRNDSDRPLAPAANYSAERKAAEWVLSIGGQITINGENGEPLALRDGKLPDADFTLDAVNLAEPPRFTNEGLSRLNACRRFNSLRLAQVAKLTDQGFAHLKHSRVRELILDGCPLLTDGVMESVATLQGLESLSVQRMKVTDAGIAALAPLKWLRTVNVATSQITDAGLLELARICPDIRDVRIDWSTGSQSVSGIARFHRLTQLQINGRQLTDDAVIIVNSIPNIGVLIVRAPMNDDTVRRLGSLKTVREFQLDSTADESAVHFSPTIFSDVEWPEGLHAFYFNGSAVSPRDEDLLHLASLPDMKVIGVSSVKESRHLQRYTRSGLVKLRESRPDLHIEVEHVVYEPGKPSPPAAAQD